MLRPQVAVTFADTALERPFIQPAPMSRDEGAAVGVDRRELVFAKRMADERLVLRDVLDRDVDARAEREPLPPGPRRRQSGRGRRNPTESNTNRFFRALRSGENRASGWNTVRC